MPCGAPSGVLLPDQEFLFELPGQALGAVCRKTHQGDSRPGAPQALDLNGMITNVLFRLERELDLPGRRRNDKANQFILENLEELQREFQVRRLPQTMSSQWRRCVK